MNQMCEDIEAARRLRELMRSDPHRPSYHFVMPEGDAMPFDPNGAIYWKGKYHLGYIYQKAVEGERVHVWGHVVSTDLLHWTIYPDMLGVEPGDAEVGIFSGGAFVSKEGVPHLIYHGWGACANMIARAADEDLKTWVKLKGSTTLEEGDPEDPKELICCHPPKSDYSVFDPHAWYDESAGSYYQITGGMKPGLFKSRDMHDWQYLGALIPPEMTMRDWYEDLSCPAFFYVGAKSMIVFISHTRGAQYYIGTFANEKFTPEKHGRMNWPGGSFFAPEHLVDNKGRNILWAWLASDFRPKHLANYGWSGTMSLPRVISLDENEIVQIQPAEELRTLRFNEVREESLSLAPNQEATLRADGKAIELQIEIVGGDSSAYGVKVFASSDGSEETVIRYEPQRRELVVDFIKSSVTGPVSVPIFSPDAYDFSKSPSAPENFKERVSEQRAPLELKVGEPLKLNIFLDHSTVEIFANGRQAVTQMVYPERPTSTQIKVFSGSEPARFQAICCWQMASTIPY